MRIGSNLAALLNHCRRELSVAGGGGRLVSSCERQEGKPKMSVINSRGVVRLLSVSRQAEKTVRFAAGTLDDRDGSCCPAGARYFTGAQRTCASRPPLDNERLFAHFPGIICRVSALCLALGPQTSQR